jgi:hypothetical protein
MQLLTLLTSEDTFVAQAATALHVVPLCAAVRRYVEDPVLQVRVWKHMLSLID